jgi:hypothetical protein
MRRTIRTRRGAFKVETLAPPGVMQICQAKTLRYVPADQNGSAADKGFPQFFSPN